MWLSPVTLLVLAPGQVAGGPWPLVIAQVYDWHQTWPSTLHHNIKTLKPNVFVENQSNSVHETVPPTIWVRHWLHACATRDTHS